MRYRRHHFLSQQEVRPRSHQVHLCCLQVNRTFQELGVFRDLGGMWEEMRPKVWDFMENSEQMDLIRVTVCFRLLLFSYLGGLIVKSTPDLNTQTLLKNNITASFFHAQLINNDWTVADVSRFLSKEAEASRPAGGGLTWREVFNETDQAITSISRFMEVRRRRRRRSSLLSCSLAQLMASVCLSV